LRDLENNSTYNNIYEADHNNLLRREAGHSGEASMQQQQKRNPLQGFDQYRASKTVLFWACAGAVLLARSSASPGAAG
jgi:hypothetical protein